MIPAAVRTTLLEGQNAVLRAMLAEEPAGAVLGRIARLAETLLPGTDCLVLCAAAAGDFRIGAATSLPAGFVAAFDGMPAVRGQGPCGTAFAARCRVLVDDLATLPDTDPVGRLAAAYGLRRCWSTWIAGEDGGAAGALAVFAAAPRAAEAWEIEILDAIAELAGTALSREASADARGRLIADLESQRQRAEEAVARLEESERSFRRFTESSSDWYWAQDEAMSFEFMGIVATADGRPVPPLGVGAEAWRAHLAVLDARAPFRDFRFQRVDPDGRLRHISINGVPVFEAADGAFKGYCGTGRDITREVEAASTLRAVIEGIPAMINAKDPQSRYVLMNSYQARLYGTTPEGAIGRTAGEILGDAYGAYTRSIDRGVVESGEPTGLYEETYATADGVERHWLTAKLPVVDARGQVQLVVTVSMDITAQKSIERRLRASQLALSEAIVQAERASQAKSDFLTNMSHELRTPLNAIIGFAEVMAGEMLGPIGSTRYREYAADIVKSGRFLHDLIADILDMAKIEAGRRDLSLGPVDVVEETRESARMLRPRAEAGGVTIDIDLGDTPVVVTADRRAFCQIVLNLLTNAVKFTRPGGRVWVALRQGENGPALEVGDTGIGIAAEELDRVGVPFFRVASPLQATAEGSGIGLALTKSLVELHGWRLAISSATGRGTVVTVILGPTVDGAALERAADAKPSLA